MAVIADKQNEKSILSQPDLGDKKIWRPSEMLIQKSSIFLGSPENFYKLAADMIVEAFLLYGLYRVGKVIYEELNTNTVTVNNVASIPDKAIAFVGRTGVGKSSTANALIGNAAFEVDSTHGTTTSIIECDYHCGYKLRDTPGLLDETDYSPLIMDAVKKSEIVIYTTVGQMYRKELDFLQTIKHIQSAWDNQSNTPNRRKLALYVNQQDVAETTKPTAAREREKQAVLEQVVTIVPKENVLFGSASPVRNGRREAARIKELQDFIKKHIQS
jgi:predicted GTPase